jgi:cytochrome b involved in lipid metabolism
MKKRLAAVTVTLLLSIMVAPGSAAAVKAGAACKKAGLTNITGGFKYTCVKKSGKLTWSKGVAVKASAKPSASASAKPSASASAAAVPSAPATVKASAAPSASAVAVPGAPYTIAKVKTQASAASCWTVISDNVYDLTKWIGQHPGGEGAIKSLCGTDGTKDFLAMHRNQSKPEARLDSYLLGPLAK